MSLRDGGGPCLQQHPPTTDLLEDPMTTTTPRPATTGTLAVPGARLHHEVRGQGPLVVLVGAPMDARAFEALAGALAADHTVLTTDPRGIHRSTVDDRGADSTPEQRADDLSRLLADLDAGPAAVLGSSGGAVSALALAQAHPEQVRTVVAHEPPLQELLEDREQLAAQADVMIARHLAGDERGAWELFLRSAGIQLPEPVFEALFGGPRDAATAADEDFQWRRMLRPTSRWVPDTALLREVPTRVVVGIGEESAGQLCDRAARALADRLGVQPVLFPGGHTGFADRTDAFAARLREVLSGEG
jgi:pimeloyl-ACP methyl ester carboxylesterase